MLSYVEFDSVVLEKKMFKKCPVAVMPPSPLFINSFKVFSALNKNGLSFLKVIFTLLKGCFVFKLVDINSVALEKEFEI